jgi:hypothetical protein
VSDRVAALLALLGLEDRADLADLAEVRALDMLLQEFAREADDDDVEAGDRARALAWWLGYSVHAPSPALAKWLRHSGFECRPIDALEGLDPEDVDTPRFTREELDRLAPLRPGDHGYRGPQPVVDTLGPRARPITFGCRDGRSS